LPKQGEECVFINDVALGYQIKLIGGLHEWCQLLAPFAKFNLMFGVKVDRNE
jgi:hypothetical protein